MGFWSVLSFAHELVKARARPGDAAVDATAGNGVDTLFLARTVGSAGTVHAFDIQQAALDATRERLMRELPEEGQASVQLHLASHDRMKELVPGLLHGQVAAVMFNLGYLPGADHSVITTPGTTLPALESALSLLRPGGVLTVAVYPGHEGGRAEADSVDAWAAGLAQASFQAMTYRFMNGRNDPPYLIAVEKR